MSSKLSIIVPCYNEEEAIPLFYPEVEKAKEKMPEVEFEYWFVNDGSTDNTLLELKKLNKKDPQHVHFVSFSRNFGKEAGLFCGLQRATGNYIVVMDVDLQDPPDFLPKMHQLLAEGNYDCIGTKRADRAGEPPIRSFFARLFYKLINRISDTTIVDGARDYRMMTRQMVNAILSVKEYNRFSKGIFSWVGFKTKYLEYSNKERSAGTTSWNFWNLLQYSIDGIVAFSDVPLNIAAFTGLFSFIGAGLAIIWIITRAVIFGDPTSGWPSLVCIILFVSGIQLFCLGIVGKYIGKIFLEVKHRPLYIVKEEK
ncbi:glycosyltransferase family 2 protein [Liquorilactobacillus oeni]|uniref:glycosyltransferase family 2 protein n=1 Tax=Liquorilactobacillus oeni TaxID=303241 RepID=UPI00070D5C47|nr:glycosyltransferase family 2 protein [Liquorilactobacillus oeni]